MSVDLIGADFTDREAGLLVECERMIERGRTRAAAGCAEMGEGLKPIREGRLYRADGLTWDAYCLSRWNMPSRQADRLIDFAEVKSITGPMGLVIHNERQARELAAFLDDPDELREVAREAHVRANGRPTAAVIRQVAQERTAKPEPEFVLRHSTSAGWVIGPPGGAPYAIASLDIAELDVAAAQQWAAAQTLAVEQREVIRWRPSPRTPDAWIAVLSEDVPAGSVPAAASPAAGTTGPDTPDPDSRPGGGDGAPAHDPRAGAPHTNNVPAGHHGGQPTPTPAPVSAGPDAPTSPARGTEEVGEGSPTEVPRTVGEPEHAAADARRDAELDAELADTAVRFRRNLSAAIARADDLWGFDVDRIAEVYAADWDTELRPFLDEMTRWCQRVTQACSSRTTGLRVMQGGRR